jgi:N-acetylneuraminate lyase
MAQLALDAHGSVMALATAAFTPFDQDGSVAWQTIERQADQLAGWGCAAVYVGGTAGEGASLTRDERRELLERWCAAAGGRMQVIAHVGHTSQREAAALARHAQDAGADAISAVPPYFHKPARPAELVDFLAPIAAAAGELPFVYYHIPGMTGVHIPASAVLVEAIERLPTFAGIKFAAGDVADLQRCLALARDEYELYIGNAQLILVAAGLGVRAAIGSVYNFAAPLYLRLLRHVAAGELDQARQCQRLAQRTIETVGGYAGELPGFKAAAGLTAVDCGPCRPPMPSLDDRQRDAMADALGAIGFLDRHPS